MLRTFSEIVDALAESVVGGSQSLTDVIIYVQNAITDANIDNYANSWFVQELSVPIQQLVGGNRWMLPGDFMHCLEVNYDYINIPIPEKRLGVVQPNSNRFWYQAGRYLAFAGNPHQVVNIAYQQHIPTYPYYPPEKRLLRSSPDPDMVFDWRPHQDADWITFNPSDDQHLASYRRHTNSFIEKWGSIVLIGAKASSFNESGNLNEGGRLFTEFNRKLARLKNLN